MNQWRRKELAGKRKKKATIELIYSFFSSFSSHHGASREAGHRIKSLSSSRFSPMERLLLELGGNEVAKGIWMHGYMKHHPELPELTSDMEVRQFMRQKYYEQRWLDRVRRPTRKGKGRKSHHYLTHIRRRCRTTWTLSIGKCTTNFLAR